MKTPTISSLIAAGLMTFAAAAAHAQQPSRITPFPVSPARGGDTVNISVSYSFRIDGDASTLQEQAKLSEEGRRALYILLGTECETLLDTIAETCTVRRANVNSQINRRARARGQGVRVSGSATYAIRFRTRERKPAND
jgi:hypothetical protein